MINYRCLYSFLSIDLVICILYNILHIYYAWRETFTLNYKYKLVVNTLGGFDNPLNKTYLLYLICEHIMCT